MAIDIQNLSYTYTFSSSPSIEGVTLKVDPGSLCLLAGASGSGKSTVLRAIAGLIPCYYQGKMTGVVMVGRRSIAHLPLSEVAKSVGFLNQNPEQGFFALCVREELLTSLYWQNVPLEKANARLSLISEWLGISDLLEKGVSEISAGQKQKVALASLLMNESVRTLVLDEPSANLDLDSCKELAKILARLKREGYTILVADHRLHWLEGVADGVCVLENGRVVAQGNFSVLSSPQIVEKYALRAIQLKVPALFRAEDLKPSLTWENLSFAYDRHTPRVFEGFSGSLSSGICALVGENGAGKSTLARLLAGLSKAQSGVISWRGKTLGTRHRNCLSALVPQNVDRTLHATSVLEEVRASAQRKMSEKEGQRILADFNLEALSQRHPQSLSGGQKQRLACASAFTSPAELLILDEPTSGLDAPNMRLMGEAMERAGKEGKGILLISHDTELLGEYAQSQIKLEKFKS